MHDYAVEVAKGNIKDDRFLPIIYKLDSVDEWQNPKSWLKANPGLGTIKSYVQLADDVERARNDASYLPTLLCKDFDMKQSDTSAWLPMSSIVNEEVADMEYLSHSYAIAGCDLSSTLDLTCATLLIRKPDDENFYILQQYFIPQAKADAVETSNAQEAPYKLWAKQGWLTICEGASVDYHQVTEWFNEMVVKHDIRPLYVFYDRALAGYWQNEMTEMGYEMCKLGQGSFSWTYPMKLLEGLLQEHKVIYQNNPILRWCLCNTAKKSTNTDGIESIQPVKIQQSRRIDGLVSLLNAYTGYVQKEEEFVPYLR